MSGKTNNPYLQILKESLIEFDKMTVHKGPVEQVVSYDGKGELDHHKPVKDVVSILERMYFQEDSDEQTEPVGMGDARDKDVENSESDEQDLGALGTATGEGNSSEAKSGGAGTLPNGSQPEGSAANAMDANDATSASRETAEVFKESFELFESVLEEMEALPNVETGENEPQGSDAIDGDTAQLGDYETETDYTGGHDTNTAENLEPKTESLFESDDEMMESLFEYDMEEGAAGDVAGYAAGGAAYGAYKKMNEADEEDGGTAVVPKPDATVGDDDSELFSTEEDEDSLEPTAVEMGMYEDDDSDDVDMNSEPEADDAGGDEDDADEEPLEVPAAGGDADDESPEDMAEYGTYESSCGTNEGSYEGSYEMGMYEGDDTGQDPGGSGMRPGADAGGSGDNTDDQSGNDAPGYDPVEEMDEEPVGDSNLDLPGNGPENAVGSDSTDYAGDENDAPNVGESLFEDDDTDDPNKFAGAKHEPGRMYHMDEGGEAEITTDNGSNIKHEMPNSDEAGHAKMEGVIHARKQVEESIVERLIREMHSYEDNTPENTIKESFDDLDDMSLEDMFDN
jgi:hypothetical protein